MPLSISLLLALSVSSCSDTATPKPMGYFRITLPEHAYTSYSSDSRPFSFEYSQASHIGSDRDKDDETEWIDVYYPTLNCRLHITYLKLSEQDEEQAFEDSHRLVYKHTIMADAIGESYFDNPEAKVYATLYEIKGNAASPIQFAITDSAGSFFRGSLYFNCKPNKDSLSPVIDYVNEDILHLIESFRWKQNQ